MLASSFDHGHALGVVHADRLFTEDVLAGFRSLYCPLGVEDVRVCNVDGIDFRICQQFFVSAVGLGDFVLRGEGLSGLEAATGCCDELTVL